MYKIVGRTADPGEKVGSVSAEKLRERAMVAMRPGTTLNSRFGASKFPSMNI